MDKIILGRARVFFLIVVLFSNCITVKQLDYNSKNPTEYIFNMKLGELRDVIISNFAHLRYKKMTLCYNGGPYQLLHSDVLSKPENSLDFVLEPTVGALGKSHIYRKGKRELEYTALFQLHMTSVDISNTKITVITTDPYVITGKQILPTLPHFVRGDRLRKVKPSSIEEYEILHYIGQLVGEQNMPSVKYP